MSTAGKRRKPSARPQLKAALLTILPIPISSIDREIEGGIYVHGGAVEIQNTVVFEGWECLMLLKRKLPALCRLDILAAGS